MVPSCQGAGWNNAICWALKGVHLVVATISSLLLIAGLSVATPSTSAINCNRSDDRKVVGLQGNFDTGNGEILVYESRIEAVEDGVRRYIYCIENHKKHRLLRVLWRWDSEKHFDGAVPPMQERARYFDTNLVGHEIQPRMLDVSGITVQPPPDTVIRGQQKVDAGHGSTLRSGAVIEIPRTADIHALVESGKYDKYEPNDFITIEFSFTSSLQKNGDGRLEIVNKLTAEVTGDSEVGEILLQSPKYVSSEQGESIGFGGQTGGVIQIMGSGDLTIAILPVGETVNERSATIMITDGTSVVAVFDVNFFTPG